GCIAWYALEHGDTYRIIFGSDSFGNTCGRNNEPIWIRSNGTETRKQFEFSGQNMTDRRFMFPLNASRAFDTIWACVRRCPDQTITSYGESLSETKNFDSLLATLTFAYWVYYIFTTISFKT
ncbi:hypothetical protein OSTOST_21599, partial [Ostertagia ostertagi]